MMHSFLTLVFIAFDYVYITVGVNISSGKILDSCTIAFLHMIVSFIMYLVRDDLINNWNQSINNAVQNIIPYDSLQNLLDSIKETSVYNNVDPGETSENTGRDWFSLGARW